MLETPRTHGKRLSTPHLNSLMSVAGPICSLPMTKCSEMTFQYLALELRERIYVMAGLVRDCAINLQEESTRWSRVHAAFERDQRNCSYESSTLAVLTWQTPGQMSELGCVARCVYDMKMEIPDYGKPGYWCLHDRLPIELFQISREIRKEVLRVFYSKNKFIMSAAWLERDTRSWLRLDLLKVVEIQLTTCSCVKDHKCPEPAKTYFQEYNPCPVCHYGCKRGDGKPLANEDIKSEAVIKNWIKFCKAMKASHTVSLTELSIIADCEDVATALTIVQPISEGFPVLQHASIRLGQSSDSELSILAKRTVEKLTRITDRRSASSKPQPLPFEVVELILQYTDLVVGDYLSWYELALSHRQQRCRYRQRGRRYRGLWRFDNKYHVCCVKCTPSREVCACPSRHAAYSSHVCNCWHFPKSLFLVNKAFYTMAVKIFCSRNRFILFEHDPPPASGENTQIQNVSNDCERLARPMEFISQMPTAWSQHIQWLKLRGTGFKWNEGLPNVDPDSYASWRTLTNLLKRWPSIERLTIEFDVSSDYQDWKLGLAIPTNEEDAAWESLWNIVKLFKLSNTPKTYRDFFIRFDYDVGSWQDDETRWLLERQMERYLMGEDYDAAMRGKYHDKRQYNESLKPKRFAAICDVTMQLTEEDLYEP